ncbi:MAG TPA: ATP-binding protein [Terriglobales bacterium]|jgi:hypothetical protein|nr:ATP-binding protein [Terriglobales bacterium]
MDLDRIIHEKKNFAELDDADLEAFLRNRSFRSEHLNLEFKSEFPRKKAGNYDIKKVCKYIVGLSNEEGGLVVYGVSDDIKNPSVAFPSYLSGLSRNPSLEDLSQWVKERIHPLIASPAIRFFNVAGHSLAVLKIPSGVNKPYCYYDPQERAITYFKKTSGGIVELSPSEIRDFHRTQIINQATQVLRAAEFQGLTESLGKKTESLSERLKAHERLILPKLEDIEGYGFIGMYCTPVGSVEFKVESLQKFLNFQRMRFAEELRYFRAIEVFQNGVSVGYFPSAIRTDIKSTYRLTLYTDGLTALDTQGDIWMDKDRSIHLGWLTYECQRHLQLSKALLKDSQANAVHIVIQFKNIEAISLIFGSRWIQKSEYGGHHHPIVRDVKLAEIYDDDGSQRNVVMPVVRDMIAEVCRIFGLSQVPSIWNAAGELLYVKGLEQQR